jgi:uncharacterized protein (UPF0248 family)
MAKRQAYPHAKREYCVEYYKHQGDPNPVTKGFAMDIWGARVGAVKHLILGHAELAICVKRKTGKVLWERRREGQNIIYVKVE